MRKKTTKPSRARASGATTTDLAARLDALTARVDALEHDGATEILRKIHERLDRLTRAALDSAPEPAPAAEGT